MTNERRRELRLRRIRLQQKLAQAAGTWFFSPELAVAEMRAQRDSEERYDSLGEWQDEVERRRGEFE